MMNDGDGDASQNGRILGDGHGSASSEGVAAAADVRSGAVCSAEVVAASASSSSSSSRSFGGGSAWAGAAAHHAAAAPPPPAPADDPYGPPRRSSLPSPSSPAPIDGGRATVENVGGFGAAAGTTTNPLHNAGALALDDDDSDDDDDSGTERSADTIPLASSRETTPYNSDRDEWKRATTTTAAAGTFTTFRLSQADVLEGVAAATDQRRSSFESSGSSLVGGGRSGRGGGRVGAQQRRASSSEQGRRLIPQNLRHNFGGSNGRDSLNDYFGDGGYNDGDADSVSIWGDVRRQMRQHPMGRLHKICLVVIAATAGTVALAGGTLPARFGQGAGAETTESAGKAVTPLRPNAATLAAAVHVPPPASPTQQEGAAIGVLSSVTDAGAGADAFFAGASYSSSADAMLQRSLEHFANVSEPWPDSSGMEVPVFWNIPRSGGRTAVRVLGECLGMVGAGRFGGSKNDGAERESSTIEIKENDEGIRHVNVDTTTPEGIERALNLGLVRSGRADFLEISRIHDASLLFDPTLAPPPSFLSKLRGVGAGGGGGPRPQPRGRIFALFRHPAKRVVSEYFHKVTTDPASLAGLSLSDYAASTDAAVSGEDNPLVRSILALAPDALVSTRHVSEAQDVLTSKVIVGITEFMDESLVRFEQYLGRWDGLRQDVEGLRCQQARIAGGDQRGGGEHAHKHFDPGTDEFQQLSVRHWADVELYHHAKLLFREQSALVAGGAPGGGVEVGQGRR